MRQKFLLTRGPMRKHREERLSMPRKPASEIISRATEDARRMHNAMLDQMRDEVADLAISIASKVVGSLINDAHQNDLRDRIIDRKHT